MLGDKVKEKIVLDRAGFHIDSAIHSIEMLKLSTSREDWETAKKIINILRLGLGEIHKEATKNSIREILSDS